MTPTLKQFEDVLDAINKTLDKNAKFTNDMEKYFDGYLYSELCEPLLESTISFLETVFQDIGNTISWWIFEKDFGTNARVDCFDENDKLIPMNSISDLYNYLVGNMHE